jgi:hypothetical protein
MLAGVLTAGVVANAFVANWRGLFEQSLNAAAVRDDGSELQWIVALHRLMGPALLPLGAVLAASFLGALGVGVAQGGGLSIHPNAIGFKLSKLNPATNLGNIFSLRGAARVMKSLVPAAVMVVFGWMALKALMLPMPVLSIVRLPHAFSAAYGRARLHGRVGGLEPAHEDDEAAAEGRGQGDDRQPAGKGADPAGAERHAAAQGEGGYRESQRGDHQPDPTTPLRSRSASRPCRRRRCWPRGAICMRRRFARRLAGRVCR